MADEHAEGTRRQHLARPHQGVPLEDAEERPSCPWVSIRAGLYGVSGRVSAQAAMLSEAVLSIEIFSEQA